MKLLLIVAVVLFVSCQHQPKKLEKLEKWVPNKSSKFNESPITRLDYNTCLKCNSYYIDGILHGRLHSKHYKTRSVKCFHTHTKLTIDEFNKGVEKYRHLFIANFYPGMAQADVDKLILIKYPKAKILPGWWTKLSGNFRYKIGDRLFINIDGIVIDGEKFIHPNYGKRIKQ